MGKQRTPAHVVTSEVRLAFPALFEPRPPIKGDTSGKLEYQATLLFPAGSPDMPRLKEAMKHAVMEKFGKVPKGLKNPIRMAEDFEDDTKINGLEDGGWFIRTKSKYQPGVVDQRLQAILDPTAIYAGCYVRAEIHAYAYDHPQGGKGVSFGLDNIQFLRHGERIDGRSNPAAVFDPVAFEPDDIPAGTGGEAAASETIDADDLFG